MADGTILGAQFFKPRTFQLTSPNNLFRGANSNTSGLLQNQKDFWDGSSQAGSFQAYQDQRRAYKQFQLRNFNQPSQTKPEAKQIDQSESKRVTVQPGDSISAILLREGFPKEQAFDPKFHEQIAKSNNLKDKNLIYPGQALNLPPLDQVDDSQEKSRPVDKEVSEPKKPVAKRPIVKQTTGNKLKKKTVKKTASTEPSTESCRG